MNKHISEKDDLSLDNICYFISYPNNEDKQDDIGNSIKPEPKKDLVFCAEKSAFSSEFYNAGMNDIKFECMLIVDTCEYNKQEKVEYDGNCYKIYRIFPRPDGFCELYLTEKAGVQNAVNR